MADKTTGQLPAVQESPIGGLPGIAEIYDDLKIPGEFQGDAVHVLGLQVKKYAQAGVKVYVEGAKQSAEDAANSAAEAAKSAEDAAGSASDAADSAETAQQYSGKPPTIIDGRWWVWNAATQQYEDTGEAARGNVMYATFWVDARTGLLHMYTDDEYTGPQFRLNGKNLEVVLTHGD